MKWSKVLPFILIAIISITFDFYSPSLAQEKVVRMALKASDIRSLEIGRASCRERV